MTQPAKTRQFERQTLAPALLLAGVAVVLLAQVWPGVPLAGGVALAAWGAAVATKHRPSQMLLSTAVYGALVLLAITAQLDAAHRSGSHGRLFLAALDAGAAAAVTLRVAQATYRRLVAA